MEKELKVFKNPEFGQIRVIEQIRDYGLSLQMYAEF